MDLNEVQIKAVEGALANKFIFSITGAAGTGKSTVIAEICNRLGTSFEVLSPTGRAADLLRQKIGKGMTIHKFLEYFSNDYGKTYRPKFNSRNKIIGYDTLIIDEASMIARDVWDNLLKALPDNVRLILVGDPHQLNPIEDTPQTSAFKLCLKHYPKIELTTRYRFGKQADLSQLSDDVLDGNLTKVMANRMLYRLDGATDEYIINKLCSNEKYYGLDAQIICPVYRGKTGCDYINKLCQLHRFPDGTPDEAGLMKGDKVIVTMNTPFFYNGNIMYYDHCSDEAIYFDRMTVPRYMEFGYQSIDLLNCVKPAYAITTHKSQGGEYQDVVYIVGKTALPVIDRSNIYTGVTRSKENLVVLYDKWTLQKGLQNVAL